jgi:hypothetical protein
MTHDLHAITKRVLQQLYNTGPKVDLNEDETPKRMFVDEKRKLAKVVSEEETIMHGAQYFGVFDVYSFEARSSDDTDQFLYRFRIVQNKKKKMRLAFKFEAYQNKDSGFLFIENFKNSNWDANDAVFREFLQICFAKIQQTKRISYIVMELNALAVQATELELLEKELENLGFGLRTNDATSPKTDRSKYEPDGKWKILIFSKTNSSDTDNGSD